MNRLITSGNRSLLFYSASNWFVVTRLVCKENSPMAVHSVVSQCSWAMKRRWIQRVDTVELTWFSCNHWHPVLYRRSPRNCHSWTQSRGNFSTSNLRVESNECHVTFAQYESCSTADVSGATCVKIWRTQKWQLSNFQLVTYTEPQTEIREKYQRRHLKALGNLTSSRSKHKVMLS